MTQAPSWRCIALLLSASLTGCASYNAMWNAQRHANDARRLEQLGQTAEARAQWTLAATKAAGVRSQKALVLRVEALAYSGDCHDITGLVGRASDLTDRTLRERVALAEAECAIMTGDAPRAQSVLGLPLTSRNTERKSRAEYAAGRAALLHQEYDSAAAHFNRAREPGTAGRALVAGQRTRIARATSRNDLQPIVIELNRLLHTVTGTEEAAHIVELLTALATMPETPAARFRAAEIARDSLQAPALAGHLFLEAAGDTASLFAPKALIAALPLLPERRDSIIAVLDSQYATSPYTRAFHGEASVAYVAAEDSLARALGIAAAGNALPSPRSRSDVPVTGPRGPKLP
jgi:hypothetical protein